MVIVYLISFLGGKCFVIRIIKNYWEWKQQSTKRELFQYVTSVNSLMKFDTHQSKLLKIYKYSPRFLLDRHMTLPPLDTWSALDSLVVTERSTARTPCVHTGSERPPSRCHYILHICICRQPSQTLVYPRGFAELGVGVIEDLMTMMTENYKLLPPSRTIIDWQNKRITDSLVM